MSSCSGSLQIGSVRKMPIAARLSNNMIWNWKVQIGQFYPAVEAIRRRGCLGVCACVCMCRPAKQKSCKHYSGSKRVPSN